MPATISRLQLDTYFLKELRFFLKDDLPKAPAKKTKEKTVNLEISDLTTPLDNGGYKWRCELTIESTNPEERHFYDFRIVMIGFFSVDENMEADEARLLAETNAPAVLYSTSREIVATVTRRSPYPGTLLPAVTFLKNTVEPKTPKKTSKDRSN